VDKVVRKLSAVKPTENTMCKMSVGKVLLSVPFPQRSDQKARVTGG